MYCMQLLNIEGDIADLERSLSCSTFCSHRISTRAQVGWLHDNLCFAHGLNLNCICKGNNCTCRANILPHHLFSAAVLEESFYTQTHIIGINWSHCRLLAWHAYCWFLIRRKTNTCSLLEITVSSWSKSLTWNKWWCRFFGLIILTAKKAISILMCYIPLK